MIILKQSQNVVSNTSFNMLLFSITGSRLGGSYLDGTTRSDLLRALETTTDSESLASTGEKWCSVYVHTFNIETEVPGQTAS